MMRNNLLLLGFACVFPIMYILGDFIGCYYMVSGSSDWCEIMVN